MSNGTVAVTYPDAATVRAYLRVPATVLSDPDLERMMGAAAGDQLARCTVPDPLPPALEQAFLRRVQREVAARNLALGMVGLDAGEYGPQAIPGIDSLVDHHERAYRTQVIG